MEEKEVAIGGDMKRQILLIVLIILNSISYVKLFTQSTWVQSYAPFGSSENKNYSVRNITVCQDGGYAVNGSFRYEVDEFYVIEYGFLMKTDSDGNYLWAKRDTVTFIEKTESYAFIETDDGGFISATTNASIGGGNALIKRDSNGIREWVNDNDRFQVWSMTRTSDGNIVLSGILNMGLPAIRKITQNGEDIWTQTYSPNRETGRLFSIIETSDGGLAATGYIQGNNLDIYVLKTDAVGDTHWTRTFDGYGFTDEGNSIVEDDYSNLITIGRIWNWETIGYIWIVDNLGNTILNEEVESDIGYEHYSVIKTSSNDFITCCHSADRAKIYCFDSEHNILWDSNLTFHYCAKGDRGIRQLDNLGFICTGSSTGREFIQIAKTDEDGNYTAINEDVINSIFNQLQIYPNPFNQTTTIKFTSQLSLGQLNIYIYNVKGQLIRDLFEIENLTSKELTVQWDGKNSNKQIVSSGLYYVIIKSENQIINSKKILMIK